MSNAARVLEVQEELGSLDAYLWAFVDGEPIVNRRRSLAELPTETELSKAISKDLKKRGFRFVGPTVIHAFMQAVGMVDDHMLSLLQARVVSETMSARLTSWIAARKVVTRSASSSTSTPARQSS